MIDIEMRARDSSPVNPTPDLTSGGGNYGRAAEKAGGRWDGIGEAANNERVVAEITHELGNFFHKLYYWTEYLQEPRADHASDVAAAEMLGQTIKNLEQFLRGALEYFRPLQVAPVRVAANEAVAAMVVQLRGQLPGWPVRVSDIGPWQGHTVCIDQARLPLVIGAVGRRLTERAPTGSGVHVTLRASSGGIDVTFYVEGGCSGSDFQSGAACIEWALAERVAVLHGGRLAERHASDGSITLTLFLPFHQ